MAISMGLEGTIGSSISGASSIVEGGKRGLKGGKNRRGRTVVYATATGAGNLMDQYRTLRVHPGASEKEVKKAFRQLALQYHPDVCKGNNCGAQFHRINEAYDIVINSMREAEAEEEQQQAWQHSTAWSVDDDDQMRGMCDSSWDLWEEWMGWEGAGIRDYSSHINPYI